MTEDEKKQFIENCFDGMKEKLIKDLDKYPDDWDGIELRWLIVDKTKEQIGYDRNAGSRKGKRYRDFVNTVIVENL